MACPLPQKDWATLLHFCYNYHYLFVTNYLITKLSVTDNFSACREYLTENRLSFPSGPRWVQHSYLSKGLRLIPYTCGSSVLCAGHGVVSTRSGLLSAGVGVRWGVAGSLSGLLRQGRPHDEDEL